MQNDCDLDSHLRNLTIKKGIENRFVIKPHFKALVFIILFPITAALVDFPDLPVMKELQLSREGH